MISLPKLLTIAKRSAVLTSFKLCTGPFREAAKIKKVIFLMAVSGGGGRKKKKKKERFFLIQSVS